MLLTLSRTFEGLLPFAPSKVSAHHTPSSNAEDALLVLAEKFRGLSNRPAIRL